MYDYECVYSMSVYTDIVWVGIWIVNTGILVHVDSVHVDAGTDMRIVYDTIYNLYSSLCIHYILVYKANIYITILLTSVARLVPG